jgi:hypothetical protein
MLVALAPAVPESGDIFHEHICAGSWAKHVIDEDWTHETQVEIADLDRDGRLDVVLCGEETDHGLAWYHNPGANSSSPWPRHRLLSGWRGLHSLELGDFDKDGDLDFLIAQMHSTEEKRVAIVENVDLAQDISRVHIIDTCGSHKAIVCDVDCDGDLDIVGKNLKPFCERFGWQSRETDWKKLVARDDIDLIDICAGSNMHMLIAVAAAKAGKHVLCEKPVAMNATEARAMLDAAQAAAQKTWVSIPGEPRTEA